LEVLAVSEEMEAWVGLETVMKVMKLAHREPEETEGPVVSVYIDEVLCLVENVYGSSFLFLCLFNILQAVVVAAAVVLVGHRLRCALSQVEIF
jgi:hypothetical protein